MIKDPKTDPTPEEAWAEATGKQPAAPDPVTDGASDAGEAETNGETAQAVVSEPAAEPAAEPAEAPMTPEDIQRQKSWEGRLKAREAELAAREAALKEQSEPAAEEATETPALEAAEPENAPTGAEDAMKRLAEDFGPEFVDLIRAVARSEAVGVARDEAGAGVGTVNGRIDQLINELKAAMASQHFAAIRDAHEDFEDLAGSPEFTQWVDGLEGDDQTNARSVMESGRAPQVIALLTKFKNSRDAQKQDQNQPKDADSVDDVWGLAAAEAPPTSVALVLPAKAGGAGDEDYSSAWDEAVGKKK